MLEAGFMNFLRTILIIILIYYVFKIVGRFLLPIFFKKVMSNVEKKFSQRPHQNNPNQTNIKEGETVIDKTPGNRSKSNDNIGEYIDYEDVE